MRSANCRMNCWLIIECAARESNIRISKMTAYREKCIL